jgi:hypothetical protein
MFHLNEKSMIRLLKEEYNNRLNSFLKEEMTVSYGKEKKDLIDSADQLKVRHEKSGLEYTFVKKDESGNNVILLLPDESRLKDSNQNISLNKFSSDNSFENKNYIIVPMQEFINDYSL